MPLPHLQRATASAPLSAPSWRTGRGGTMRRGGPGLRPAGVRPHASHYPPVPRAVVAPRNAAQVASLMRVGGAGHATDGFPHFSCT